jgi:hypothetical protein
VVGGLGLGLLLRISDSKTYIKFTIYAAVIAVIFAVFINGLNAFKKAQASSKYRVGYRNTVMRISKIADPDYLVTSCWNRGILFEHYVFQKSFTPHWINLEWVAGFWGRDKSDESSEKLYQAIAAHRQIWLLEEQPHLISILWRSGYKITKFDSAPFDTVRGPILVPIYVANAEK